MYFIPYFFFFFLFIYKFDVVIWILFDVKLNELKIEKSNDALNMSGSSMANSELSLRFPTLYKANERIKQLEYELYELKMKLERSESRLVSILMLFCHV